MRSEFSLRQKFLNVSIRAKLNGAFFFIILLTGITFSVNTVVTVNLLNHFQEERETELIRNEIESRMESDLQSAESVLKLIKNHSLAMKAFAERDRGRLLDIFSESFADLRDAGFEQFQFHLPDATSFLRLHEPEKFGDSLASFRHTVNKANKDLELIRGLEEGRAGFGFRVVLPLFYENRHIGSAELGSNFSRGFLTKLQLDLGGNFYIYRFSGIDSVAWDQNSGSSKPLSATADEDPYPVSREDEKFLREGKAVFHSGSDGHSVISVPFRDYSGNYTGYIKTIRDRSGFAAVIQKTYLITIIIISSGLLLSGLIAYLIQKLINDPIRKSMAFASTIAEGDLTSVLNISRMDETGKLIQSLNNMKDHLQTLIKSIIENSESAGRSADAVTTGAAEISRASDQVSVTMEELAAGASALNDAAAEAWSASVRLDASQQNVTETALMVKEEVDAIDRSALAAGNAASKAGESIQTIQDIMKQTSSSVEDLSSRLTSINDMTGTINSITEQINLLSLNASIEAARAGEAGRGFAVVAESVSRLAEQSAAATNEINQSIADITVSASHTLRSIETGVRQVDAGSAEIRNALTMMKSISEMIRTLAGRMDVIVRAVQVQHDHTSKV